MDTHDVCMPLVTPQGEPGAYRFILISPADLALPATEERLQRLLFLDGGKNAAIIFLLCDDGPGDSMQAFMELQIK